VTGDTAALCALAEALETRTAGDPPVELLTEMRIGEPGLRSWLYVVNRDAGQGTGVRVAGGRYQTVTGLDLGPADDLPAVVDALLTDIGYPAHLKTLSPADGGDTEPGLPAGFLA